MTGSAAPTARPAAGLPPVTGPDEITAAWLARALAAEITGVTVTRIGSGQIGSCYRCRVTGPGVAAGAAPAAVLVKLPTDDPGTRGMLAGAYRAEVGFYRELAATVAVDVPDCHAATDVTDDGRFTLVLEDLAPAEQGDQLAGCDPDRVRAAAVNLAGLHGPRWCDESLFDAGWLTRHDQDAADVLAQVYAPAVEEFLRGIGHLLSAPAQQVVRRTVPVVAGWSLGRPERFGLVHGDYRLDNLMFHPDPPPGTPSVHAVDWQTLSVALPARDLAYLLGTGLSVEDRRACERDLVAAYHRALAGHGVTGYDAAQCWDDYRYAMLQGVLVAVFGCAYGTRTDRGDRMFAAMVERTTAAMTDLGTLEIS